jgi:hypothetical protein
MGNGEWGMGNGEKRGMGNGKSGEWWIVVNRVNEVNRVRGGGGGVAPLRGAVLMWPLP